MRTCREPAKSLSLRLYRSVPSMGTALWGGPDIDGGEAPLQRLLQGRRRARARCGRARRTGVCWNVNSGGLSKLTPITHKQKRGLEHWEDLGDPAYQHIKPQSGGFERLYICPYQYRRLRLCLVSGRVDFLYMNELSGFAAMSPIGYSQDSGPFLVDWIPPWVVSHVLSESLAGRGGIWTASKWIVKVNYLQTMVDEHRSADGAFRVTPSS